mmetsp:Transcript_95286/g.149994  ORF Transcript_95286/g.149994 Transcript_95286/m.149994 type:complete len:370 (-) Transcript_95286:41-1150(-)
MPLSERGVAESAPSFLMRDGSMLSWPTSAGESNPSSTWSILSSTSRPTRWALWKARKEAVDDLAGVHELLESQCPTTGWRRSASSCPAARALKIKKQFAAPGWNPPPLPGASRNVGRPTWRSLSRDCTRGLDDNSIRQVLLEPPSNYSARGCAEPPRLHGLDPRTLESREIFEELCVRKYTSLCRAWRLLLDPKGVGRVSFHALCEASRSVGFHDTSRLWAALDRNRSGFVTMDEWDPEVFQLLMDFRQLCNREYGSLEHAFVMALDTTKSRTVMLQELRDFCFRHDFRGNVKALMEALDVNRHGFLRIGDLEFLSTWQGERHVKTTPHFEMKSARLWAPHAPTRERGRRFCRKSAMPKSDLALTTSSA